MKNAMQAFAMPEDAIGHFRDCGGSHSYLGFQAFWVKSALLQWLRSIILLKSFYNY